MGETRVDGELAEGIRFDGSVEAVSGCTSRFTRAAIAAWQEWNLADLRQKASKIMFHHCGFAFAMLGWWQK